MMASRHAAAALVRPAARQTRSATRLLAAAAMVAPPSSPPPNGEIARRGAAKKRGDEAAVTSKHWPTAKRAKRSKPAAGADGKPAAKKKRKAAAAAPKAGLEPREPPGTWREELDLMIELRKERNAPVDSMGAEELGDKDGGAFEFHTLIALMLSSQTKDQTVAETMERLKAHGLTVDNIAATSHEKLNELIGKVGFHNNKTRYIKSAVDILRSEHAGRVPDTYEGLIALPGVGPKMAFLVLNIAFKKAELGIGVDTHMHRMCNQLGWVESSKPDDTRKQLESWLPRDEWHHINLTMVGLGQMLQQPAYRTKMVRFLATWPETRRAQARDLLLRLGLAARHLESGQEEGDEK